METFEKWIQLSGPLFEAVQTASVFKDSKHFVDMVPKKDPEEILKNFSQNLDLEKFVDENFELPKLPPFVKPDTKNLHEYILLMWEQLLRSMKAASPYDSLISLPNPHMVPGGRFRECYYWDSYFVILALLKIGHHETAHKMVENFAYLINHFGHIPNGNRYYYLTRSQPPFFSLMLDATRQSFDQEVATEKAYWDRHKIDGYYRYCDDTDTPRQESYREDLAIGKNYKHIRAACASGWDFSSRWLQDPQDLSTICTMDILPVDLNALLGDSCDFFWSDEKQFYCDYNSKTKTHTDILSLAGTYPLFMKKASSERAEKVAKKLESDFLLPGGLQATLTVSGQQWDAPIVWAPLQWIAICGLKNYGFDTLAKEIGHRFKAMATKHFEKSGTLFEKYDGNQIDRLPNEGEYTNQEGFGWTNAILTLL